MSDPLIPTIYEGIWGILARWFKVPRTPPTLPASPGEQIDVFRAAPAHLKYCLFSYWIGFWFLLFFVIAVLIVITIAMPPVGIVVSIPALLLFSFLSVLNYVAVYLVYDTTWYAVGPHSVRTRGGIWVNREITINYENVQNVSMSQGPLQRHYGISNVRIDTAGLQGAGSQYESAKSTGVLLSGLSNAEAIKALIQTRCDASKSAGLGDEEGAGIPSGTQGWSREHVALLRDIRDATEALIHR